MNYSSTKGYWLQGEQWNLYECNHDEHVISLEPCEADRNLPFYIPAPVDLHVHGGGGVDVMQGADAIVKVLKTHARHGTGAMLATSVTAPVSDIDRFLVDVQHVMNNPPEDGSTLLGAHLEGPYINPDKLGAQPAYAAPVDAVQLERWLSTGVVKIITYAPEQDNQHVVAGLCARYNVKAQMGHTLCNWSQALAAIQAGCGVTHLFNAMSGVSHRDGGAALAALAYSDYAEIITDGIHADKAAFDSARRAIPRLYSVTDATAASGMSDGYYQLGSLTIEKQSERVILPDGTLAGSCLTQLASIGLLRSWGLSWPQISSLSSEYPSQWVGRAELGAIAVGAIANWLEILDDQIVAIWLRGNRTSIGEYS